jgi:hypothetical protein
MVMDGSDIVAYRLLRFARNDSSLWKEMRSGAVDLLAMTVAGEDCLAFHCHCEPNFGEAIFVS